MRERHAVHSYGLIRAECVGDIVALPWLPDRCAVLTQERGGNAGLHPADWEDNKTKKNVWVPRGQYKFCYRGKLYVIAVRGGVRGDYLEGVVRRPIIKIPVQCA